MSQTVPVPFGERHDALGDVREHRKASPLPELWTGGILPLADGQAGDGSAP